MAKPLTAAKNTMQQNLNNSNTSQLSVRMTVAYLKEHLDEEFINLFSHTDETARHLADSFLDNGYDNSQPVHLAHIESEDKDIVIDGMTRLHALELANFFDVPVYKHNFKTRLDALMYAYRLQLDRRNLNDAQKLAAVEKMLLLKNPENQKGKTAAIIAAQLNMSTRNAEKMINIIKNGDEETKQAVLSQKLSVNKAEKKVQSGKKAARQENFELESEDFFPPELKEIDEETKKAVIDGKVKFSELKPKENKTSAETFSSGQECPEEYKKGYTDGFVDGTLYVIGNVLAEVDLKRIYERIFSQIPSWEHTKGYFVYDKHERSRFLTDEVMKEINRLRKELRKKNIPDYNPIPYENPD